MTRRPRDAGSKQGADPSGPLEIRHRTIAILCPPDSSPIEYRGPTEKTFFSSSLVHLLEQISSEERPIVLIHCGTLNENDIELATRLPDLPGRPTLAVLAKDKNLDQAVSMARRLNLGTVFPDDCLLYPSEIERWVDWIECGGPASGIEPHLQPGARITSRRLMAKSDKAEIIDSILSFVGEIRPDRALEFNLRLILEEVVNNAIFHACVDEAGEEKYTIGSFERVDDDEVIELDYGADENTIAVSIRDNRGLLTRETFLGKIERQASMKGLLDISGRGLYLTYSLAERLVVNLRPGKLSELVVLTRTDERAWPDRTKQRPILIFEASP